MGRRERVGGKMLRFGFGPGDCKAGAGGRLRVEMWGLTFRSQGACSINNHRVGSCGDVKEALGQAWEAWGEPHHFVLVKHQPIVVWHEAEAVPPLLVVLLVLEEVPREDDALLQGHLWAVRGGE